VPSTAPAAGEILVGNAGGTAYAKAAVSGDATLASTGALTIAADAVTNAKLATAAKTNVVGITIDGGGSAITTGVKGFIQVPYACTITSWRIFADVAGAIVIDVWRDTYANFPPTNAGAMPGGGKEPTIAATNQKAEDTDVTDWTSDDIVAGDVLGFNVDSCTTITRATLPERLWTRMTGDFGFMELCEFSFSEEIRL
jgi:hypothetical protein